MAISDLAARPLPVRARMEPLARLPVFFGLQGRRVLVLGGTSAAAWKVELLSAAGAVVDAVAPEMSCEMVQVAASPPQGPITLHVRDWSASDLEGAALAIGDSADEAEVTRFVAAARAAGVPVNMIDNPAPSDFTFGAIVNRSPLVVGISTDGGAPVFGQAVRGRIEALLPAGFRGWASAAKVWRENVSGLSTRARRTFWERFSQRALQRPHNVPDEADRTALLSNLERVGEDAGRGGSVVLVGAGPGDPELLTLKAVRALQSADVVLYDNLVSSEVLDFARREAKKMLVGKIGHGPSCKQDDINRMMVSLAREGRRVVRLKGGEPMIFGRAGEEIAACRAAGVPVESIPGISAPQGAANRLLTSLTHRDHARRLQFVTAHGRDGKLPKDLDFKALSDPAATTVVYMPRRTLGVLVAALEIAGADLSTPALAIFSATRPDEKVVAAPLGQLEAAVSAAHEAGAEGPCLVLYGHALAEAAALPADVWPGEAAPIAAVAAG
ncbi:siroheme synthase CysG [Xanthobacter sp. TB0139]|uniref:siroheme synthase CysG n=1 Tax=Xanthobacter sp. TB0139 TaxID=3459178 RepID=UPI0040399075